MAFSYSTDLKDARMQLVADLVAGLTPAASTGTPSAGKLVIMTDLNVILASFDLETDPFSLTGGVLTLNGTPISTTGITDGIAAKAQFVDNADTVVITGLTVGTAGASVLVTDVNVYEDEDVILSGCTISHA